MTCLGKTSTYRRGYRGPPQLLMWGGIVFMIIKLTVNNMAPILKLPFTFVQGNYFSFRCHAGVLERIYTPLTRRKIGGGCHPFEKYSHSVDHVPRSNKTLFLIPLILNFISATVSILFPQFACPFQKSSTNRLWRSKWSWFIAWRIWGTESSIQIQLFHGRAWVCGPGSIRCVLLSMTKDKKYLCHNWMGGEYRDSLLYYPTLKFQCLDVCIKGIPILLRGTRSNPLSPFLGDRK